MQPDVRVGRFVTGIGVVMCSWLMLGAAFVWDGGGANDTWSTVENWDCPNEPAGYPDDTGDDATIPFTSGGYLVDLTTESINDLTIEGNVDFDTAGGATTLTVDSLIIDGSSNAIVVKITSTTIRNF